MSQQDDFSNDDPKPLPPLDLAKWRKLPGQLIGVGALVTILGLVLSGSKDSFVTFGYSWLTAYMFCLSIGVGSLFLVLVHHLFDAGWSVPIRRFCEHLSTLLFPTMFILWIPLGVLAPKIYSWMEMLRTHTEDHALHAKQPMFSLAGFYIISAFCFLTWWFLTTRLKNWSVKQDETGSAECTHKLRFYSYIGIFLFAVSVTLAVIMWMKALQHQWFSTMYGVYYFAGSVWMTLALVYVITMILDRQKIISEVLHEHQYYFIGSLLFAFTVFYAYVTFSQYFIQWNANMPEETFWYVLREKGTWFYVCMVIIFGHFFVPFLSLLRIDVKSKFHLMVPIGIWAWLMHFVDMCFNVLPVHFPDGFPFQWIWLPLGIAALMLGVMAKVFLAKFATTAPYPIKDPRLIEAMGLYHPVATPISGGELGDAGNLRGAPKGGH